MHVGDRGSDPLVSSGLPAIAYKRRFQEAEVMADQRGLPVLAIAAGAVNTGGSR